MYIETSGMTLKDVGAASFCISIMKWFYASVFGIYRCLIHKVYVTIHVCILNILPVGRGLQRTAQAATRHGTRDPLVRPQVDQTYLDKI